MSQNAYSCDVQGVIARAAKLILSAKRKGLYLILFWGNFLTAVIYGPGLLCQIVTKEASGQVNEMRIVEVLFELPKYIVTTDQIIPTEIIIDMQKWPGSTIDNHVFAFTYSHFRIQPVTACMSQTSLLVLVIFLSRSSSHSYTELSFKYLKLHTERKIQ